jgi:hypothetical protein
MYKEVWRKYMKGFKFLLPFILVRTLYESIMHNLGFSTYDFYDFFKGNLSGLKQAVVDNFVPILFQLFVGSLFCAFLMVVIKELINEKRVNYREDLKESLGIYLRYLALTIIMYAITIGVLLLGAFDIIMPIVYIFVTSYLSPILIPCDAYLVYNNTNPVEALKEGTSLGKKYYVEILFLGIIFGVISLLLGIIFKMASPIGMDLRTNPMGYACIELIEISVWTYLCMFIMAICKKEEKTVEKITEC